MISVQRDERFQINSDSQMLLLWDEAARGFQQSPAESTYSSSGLICAFSYGRHKSAGDPSACVGSPSESPGLLMCFEGHFAPVGICIGITFWPLLGAVPTSLGSDHLLSYPRYWEGVGIGGWLDSSQLTAPPCVFRHPKAQSSDFLLLKPEKGRGWARCQELRYEQAGLPH